jgi:hypothetical protein
LLEAIDDPTHERHADLGDWIPDDFDPAIADIKSHIDEVAALARKWSRKPATKRTVRR